MHLLLSNSESKVKLCRKGFGYLKKQGMATGWRMHSAGYAVLQFTQLGKIRTHYMHKLLAGAFVERPEISKRLFVRMCNSDKLDCRVENLEWVTMNDLRRQQQHEKGYRGVSRDGEKFRAVLYDEGQRIYLGIYATEEEAALAYDEASFRRFGLTNSINFRSRFESIEH